MTSFFGSIRSLFKGKDKPGQPTRISKYEDEIKLLLDTVVLANPSVLGGGFTIFGPAASPTPTLSEAMRGGKVVIKSLCELLIGMTYMTEKGTIVLRVNVDEVILGGGKIQLPVLLEDWQHSKQVTQYCMRGSLHPDTLIIAVENFTQKRVREGLLVYEQSKKAGRLIFDFAQLQSGAIYATAEDNIMLERASEPPYINFTFGRNLYWYVKSQREKTGAGGIESKENIDGQIGVHVNRTPTKGQYGKSPSKRTPTRKNGGHSNDGTNGVAPGATFPGGAPPPPPIPPALRALKLDANGVPMCGTPPPPPGAKKRQRKVRQLYWTKIPQSQLAGTIWKEKGSPSRVAVDIDVDELENMFSLSPMKDASGKPLTFGAARGGSQADSAAPAKVQLLDLKRANNGAVLLSQFKNLEHGEIRNALLTMDERNILTIENLISLKYLFPLSDQERHDIMNFKGDPKQCGPAEQFYLATVDVPRPDVRIRMLIFRHQYSEVSQHLEAAMHILRQGSQELVDSDKLAQVLQLVLKLGRALNDGSTSSSSSASGFRLESLSKLADTKAKDKKTSVLDYLVTVIMRQKPELVEFWTELPYLDHVSKLPTETITEGLKEIKDTLDALKLEMELIAVNMSDAMIAKAKEIADKQAERELNASSAASAPSLALPFDDPSTSSSAPIESTSSDFVFSSNNRATMSSSTHSGNTSEEESEASVRVDSKFADAYFKAHMSQFYEKTLALYLSSKKRHEATIHCFEKAVKYFGEDPKVTQPAAFFSLITGFVEHWRASKGKIDKAAADREKAELRAQKEAEKARQKEEQARLAEEEKKRVQEEEEMARQRTEVPLEAMSAEERPEEPANSVVEILPVPSNSESVGVENTDAASKEEESNIPVEENSVEEIAVPSIQVIPEAVLSDEVSHVPFDVFFIQENPSSYGIEEVVVEDEEEEYEEIMLEETATSPCNDFQMEIPQQEDEFVPFEEMTNEDSIDF